MKLLNAEMTSLLDKLYNLRGKDSVVLVSMEKDRQAALETRERTSILKDELQTKINNLTAEETVLAEEGSKLQAVLSTINKEQFGNVISHLGIDFDPEALRRKVDEKLPETLEKVASEKKSASEELVKVEDEMNESITKIEELGIRRDEALSNQERLNKYFELALNSNINITRDEITSLLAKFDFTEEEQREAAKILMFPEDGLFDYENGYDQRRAVERKADEIVKEISKPTVEPKIEAEQVKVEAEPTPEEIKPVLLEEEVASLVVTPEAEPEKKVEKTTITKDELTKFLKENGFDELDFTDKDIELMIEHFDAQLFANNIKMFDTYGISKDVFFDNVELLYDTELAAKVEKLISVGKTPQDIYLNPNVLIKYTVVELNNAIEVLTESGLDPKNVPLMAY